MQKLTEEGTHLVEIYEASWKEGKDSIRASLFGKVEIEDGECYIEASLNMSDRMRSDSKTWTEAHMETLTALGMDPEACDIDAVVGSKAEFVCEHSDEYGMQVKFVNPPRKKVSNAKALEFLKKTGFKPKVKTAAAAPTETDDDDIPFA